jgi:antitoxin (DNA-binding transcriptional repressor) of toxin-antitoxin stability system
MRDLRNHTRAVFERAQTEPVTITDDDGVPIALLTALPSNRTRWDANAWLDRVTGSDWAPYESGLATEVETAHRSDDNEPDAVDRLGLA